MKFGKCISSRCCNFFTWIKAQKFCCATCRRYEKVQRHPRKETYPNYHAEYYQKHKHTKFKEYRKRWKNSDKSKDYERKYRVKRRYGLTRTNHLNLLESQNWECAFVNCLTPVNLHSDVDHNHGCCPGENACGKCVRGILCHQHNNGLAFFEDRPETLLSALSYLNQRGSKNA